MEITGSWSRFRRCVVSRESYLQAPPHCNTLILTTDYILNTLVPTLTLDRCETNVYSFLKGDVV